MRPFPIAGRIKTVLKEKRGRFGRPLYRQRIRELAQDRFANRYRLKLDLTVFFQGSSLLFEGSEAGLMQGVFHRAAPIPGRVDNGLVEHGAEAFQLGAVEGFLGGIQMLTQLLVTTLQLAFVPFLDILGQLPLSKAVLVLLVLCMITFYSTSFDSITMVASTYTYKKLQSDEEPHRNVKLFWAIFLILLPLAVMLFRRTLREAVVALSGAILPLFFAGFIHWAAGGRFDGPVRQVAAAITSDSGYRFFDGNTLFSLIAWGVIFFLLICSAAGVLLDIRTLKTKPRNILFYNLYVLCVVAGIYFVPYSSPVTLTLAAPAAATLIPVVLTKFNSAAASMFYTVLILLSLVLGLI